MTPQELKSSILQLAIQGKLVEQRPEEGTAEELYQQIQEEKRHLIKEGKIKKEKSLPEIAEDEVPFEIPESWKWIRLGRISRLITKGTTPRDGNVSYLEEGVGFLRAENVAGFDKLDKTNLKYIDEKTHIGYLKRSIIQENDILITIAGTLGRTAIVKKRDLPLNANQAISMVRLINSNCVELLYLIYALNSDGIQKYLVGQKKTTAIPNLTLEIIENCVIPLPPLAEQKRIVAKIEELLPYIDRYEQAWNRLEDFNKRFPVDMQKSLLQWAIQGKLVEQRPEEGTAEELYRQIQEEKQRLVKEGKIKKEKPLPEIAEDEVPFEIPESWKWVRFLSVVNIATNLVQPSKYLEYMHIAPDNIEKATGRLLACHTVKEDKVASANHLFHKGQIIYSKIRPLLRKAVVAPFDGLCSADMYPLNTALEAKYVLYYLLSDGYNTQVAEVMSSRVKMPKINQNELKKVLLPLPPLAEQKRIVAKLEELLPLCERLK